MSNSFKTLEDCGADYPSFLHQPDAEWIFTKGACHAFALELADHFLETRGRKVEIYYCFTSHESTAQHVFVMDGDRYWDVSGPHSCHEIAQKWANSDTSKLRKVPNLGWLTKPNPNYLPNTSFLGLCVTPDFLDKARQKAHAFIASRNF